MGITKLECEASRNILSVTGHMERGAMAQDLSDMDSDPFVLSEDTKTVVVHAFFMMQYGTRGGKGAT